MPDRAAAAAAAAVSPPQRPQAAEAAEKKKIINITEAEADTAADMLRKNHGVRREI